MMVKYEFVCDGCGITIELLREMGDTNPPDCLCGDRMRKVFHSTPVKFNTDGFYSTGG